MRTDVSLRPYGAQDLPLLQRLLGDAAMMEHLGGAESVEAIAGRHERYLAPSNERQGLFTVLLCEEPVGWVGYWESAWQGGDVWECGWHVVPEAQGRGVATTAAYLMLARVREAEVHRFVHAFPAIQNAASNAVCERLGFEFLCMVEVEYPKGRMMQANDWRLDLEDSALTIDEPKG